MTLLPELVRLRVLRDPVCSFRSGDGRYCRGLSVSAELAPSGDPDAVRDYQARCPEHAAADAPRFCLTCRGPNDDADGYRCASCAIGRDGAADDRERWIE